MHAVRDTEGPKASPMASQRDRPHKAVETGSERSRLIGRGPFARLSPAYELNHETNGLRGGPRRLTTIRS
jgi:hypothetical protein